VKSHAEMLAAMNACPEAVKFADRYCSLETAWEACPRSDWMLWLLKGIEYEDDRSHRLFACWCARNTPLADGRKVWDLLTDRRSRDAVEVAERFADGNATKKDLAAAKDAAKDAALDAAWAAAWTAAGAAARGAARDAAWTAARAAAWTAAGAAARGAARDVAWDAAWDAARDAQADQLRAMFPWTKVAACWAKKEGLL
jgi:hypothetical protein